MRSLPVLLATVGGVGYAPVAPGTVASLLALPLLPPLAALRSWSSVTAVLVVVAVAALAVWAAGRAESHTDGHDHASIVIDEVAGVAVTGLFLPGTWTAALLGVALFRVFDVWKPFPARTIDARVHGGLGVVGDDLVAGAYAGLAARGILALW